MWFGLLTHMEWPIYPSMFLCSQYFKDSKFIKVIMLFIQNDCMDSVFELLNAVTLEKKTEKAKGEKAVKNKT